MAVLEQLLEYQKEDAKLWEIEKKLAGSEECKKFRQAKKFMDVAREKLEAQDSRAVELERLRDELIQRMAEIEKQIAENLDVVTEMLGEEVDDVSYYKKNAQTLQERLRAVKAEMKKLTEAIATATEEYKRLREQTLAMQKQGAAYSKKFKEVKEKYAIEAKPIDAMLKAMAKSIPSDLMQKYQEKRKEKIFPILAPLTNDRCMCGMEFSIAQRDKLSGGNVVECEHCRRFVYKA